MDFVTRTVSNGKDYDYIVFSCYTNNMSQGSVKNCAVDNGIKTIAFPSITIGVYSYPTEQQSLL